MTAVPAVVKMVSLDTTAYKIVSRLHEAGYIAYFAGGAVRDRLLGKEAHDIDIATDARPEDVQRLFRRTEPIGVQFGIVLVIENGQPFEVATFRADGNYLDGRRPQGVSFTTPEGDAARRDFTVNGLFYDPLENKILDFVGGRADLDARILRAIGDPRERFTEDKLRILRAVRFATTLGFDIEPATWQAVCDFAPEIRVVSAERIRVELIKIFTSPNRARGLDLLDESGLLGILLPEVSACKGCEQPPDFHPEGDVFVHTRLMLENLDLAISPELALATLLHDIGKPPCRRVDSTGRIRFNGHESVGARLAAEILRRYRFSNDEVTAVEEMIANHMVFKDTPRMRISRLRRFMARPTFEQEMELHRVDCASSHGEMDIYEFLRAKQEEFRNEPLVPPRLLTGKDLLALGWRPGPRLGKILNEIQNRQLEGELTTREAALSWLMNNEK